jgi:hypothetical protein
VVAAVAVAALLCVLTAAAARAATFGPAGTADLPQKRLFDIGATDYDGDGSLDLFSTNHKARAVLLRNDGTGNFSDEFSNLGLSPSPGFPGLEYLRAPDMTDPAIYLWYTDSPAEKLAGVLHIRSVGAQGSGTVVFESDSASVVRKDNATVSSGRSPEDRPQVDFDVKPGSSIDIRVDHIDLPASVSFRGTLPVDLPLPISQLQPAEVRVGTLGVVAPSRRFVLSLLDRHGFTFADLGGDQGTDIFMVSGGLGGEIALPDYAGRVKDQLYVASGGTFTDQITGTGLVKGTCRGRQSAAIDIDANGLLDLFESCQGEPPKIFMQTSAGQFEPAASSPPISKDYRWTNLGGRKPELLAAQKNGIHVYQQTANGWKTVQVVADNAKQGAVMQFALDDFDSDGLLDVLAVAKSGNTLLRNDKGRLREVPLSGTGLPKGSLAASFVDYDNDGNEDVDLVPQGLYKGSGGGHYKRTGELAVGHSAGSALTTWFDADNDGLRDPVIAFGNAEFAKQMSLVRERNLGPGGQWLEVDLTGATGNRQAVGARVAISVGGRKQYQFVGQNDDSHHSQGHYRLYFGLGGAITIDRLAVRWPDGKMTRMQDVSADQLLTIAQP